MTTSSSFLDRVSIALICSSVSPARTSLAKIVSLTSAILSLLFFLIGLICLYRLFGFCRFAFLCRFLRLLLHRFNLCFQRSDFRILVGACLLRKFGFEFRNFFILLLDEDILVLNPYI